MAAKAFLVCQRINVNIAIWKKGGEEEKGEMMGEEKSRVLER